MNALEPAGQFIVYIDEASAARIDVRFDGDTVWFTQAQLAELFGTTPQNITQHIAAIYDEGELNQDATHQDYLQVRTEGSRQVRRSLTHYDRDILTSVGQVSHKLAQAHVDAEYEQYQQRESVLAESDFDRFSMRMLQHSKTNRQTEPREN